MGAASKKLSLALVAVVTSVTACAAVLGIEAGVDDTSRDAGGADGSTLDVADDTTQPPCVNDASTARPDQAVGVFVASGLADNGTCGAITQPCGSIQRGIEQALATNKSVVYVAAGTYKESITLAAGITIEGGWVALGSDFLPSCADSANTAVSIVAPDDKNTTVLAPADMNGIAGLRRLSIKSKPVAAAGESLYGIAAYGATTTVVLDDVVVKMADGGNGAEGTPGTIPARTGSGCTPDSGAPATLRGSAGANADAGFITEAGFVGGGGATQGNPGNSGANGTVAPPPPTCASCVKNCGGTAGVCTSQSNGTSCGTAGSAGCGGAGGGPGQPGGSGGSSVAVWAWGATVSCVGGSLAAGNGGKGANGGAGGDGGAGGLGAPGAPGPACAVDCTGFNCLAVDGGGTAGAAGGTGGQGSAGGNGGAGAGGWSFVIVSGADASVMLDGGTKLAPGQPGTSNGGAQGSAGERWPP